MIEKTFYTYVYIDPINNRPFYVGKGTGYRKDIHIKKVKNNKMPNNNWYLYRRIKDILSTGLEPIVRIVYNGSEELSLIIETHIIHNMKKLEIELCNLTDGGDGLSGYHHTTESKKLISENNSRYWKGKKFSEKHRTKLKRKFSEEHKKKLSDIRKELWKNSEYADKVNSKKYRKKHE